MSTKTIDPKILKGMTDVFAGRRTVGQVNQDSQQGQQNQNGQQASASTTQNSEVNTPALTLIPHDDASQQTSQAQAQQPNTGAAGQTSQSSDDKVVEKMPKEAQIAFKNMRASMVEAERKANEATAKVAEYEAKAKQIEEKIKELEAKPATQENATKIAELEKKLAQYDLMYDPDFKANYIEPVNKKKSEIETTLISLGLEQVHVDRVLKLKGKDRLDELRQHIPDYAVGLIPIFAEHDRLSTAMIKAIQDESETRKVLVDKRHEQQAKTVEQAIYKLSDHPLLRKTQNADYDKKIDERVAKIKSKINEKYDTGEMLAKAVMYDDYRSLYTELYTHYVKLKKDNELLMKANPSIRISSGDTSSGKKEMPKTITPQEIARQFATGRR